MATFRKSKKIGPVRFTLSPKGISTSAGVPGARVSVGADGKVRRTVGIPGTGVYDTKVVGDLGGKQKQPAAAVPAQFAPVEAAGKGMTMVELQQFLNEAATAGVPADTVPLVEVTIRGRIKKIKLP